MGGLLQITYPRFLCLLVSRWIHTVRDTVESPRSRETKKTGNFALISLLRLVVWQWQRLLQGACSCQAVLVSPLLIPTDQRDPAFSIVLGFLQFLHSGVPHSPLVFILPTPLQLFPCTKFLFLDDLGLDSVFVPGI